MRYNRLHVQGCSAAQQAPANSSPALGLQSSVLTGFSIIFVLVLLGGMLPTLTLARQPVVQDTQAQALMRYYVEIARDACQVENIRRALRPFSVAVVVRRYTLDSNADTLQLDTAIVRAYFTPQLIEADSNLPDTLKPDSQVVLRSSFLDEEPPLPALFLRPAWEGEFAYSLFPNDPGRGDIALAYDSLSRDGGLSRVGSSGIFTINRSSGTLQYSTLLIRSDNGVSRYSRETFYTLVNGFLVPERIIEHINRLSIWGNQFEIRETRFLRLSFEDYE